MFIFSIFLRHKLIKAQNGTAIENEDMLGQDGMRTRSYLVKFDIGLFVR
jgi:hypothetical protein